MTTPSANPTTNVTGTNAPESSSSRSEAGLSTTATQRPRSVPSTSTTSAPIRSCTQSASGSSIGSAYKRRAGEPLGGGAIGESRRSARASAAVGGRLGDRQPSAAAPKSRSRLDPLRAVGRQVRRTRRRGRRAPGRSGQPRAGRRAARIIGHDSVVEELDVELDTVLRGGGTGDRANAGRGAATPADHPAEIAGPTRTSRRVRSTDRRLLDGDGFGIVDDRLDDVASGRRPPSAPRARSTTRSLRRP